MEKLIYLRYYTNEEKYLVEFSSRFNSTSRREEGVERAPQPMINAEFGVIPFRVSKETHAKLDSFRIEA